VPTGTTVAALRRSDGAPARGAASMPAATSSRVAVGLDRVRPSGPAAVSPGEAPSPPGNREVAA
jgi:hypothetical protein